MKKSILLSASLLTGVAYVVSVATPVYAWHPKGEIKKYVQNVTQNSAKSDANTAATAVAANTGDVLKYTIEIKNSASAASNGYNDLYYIELRDTLPQGVELVSDAAKRDIKESLGMLKPGQSVVKEYAVKVTSKTDDAVITNKACFTGDSKVKDNKQAGCDDAVVKTDIPQVIPPVVTEKPGKGAGEVQAKVVELPKTGAASVATAFAGTTSIGYVLHAITRKLRR